MERREQIHIENIETNKELPPNVVVVETPEARFRIIYGAHTTEQDPRDLGNSDALILESGSYNYLDENPVSVMRQLAENEQYKKISQTAKEKERPIFLADLPTSLVKVLLYAGLKGAEITVGIAILQALYADIKSQSGVSRRNFLKKMIKGGAGLWLSPQAPGVAAYFMGGQLDERTARRTISRFLTDLNEEIHPETEAAALTLRNYIMAQKMETIARELKTRDRKSEVAIVLGASHTGIEKVLEKKTEERNKIIDTLLSVLPGAKRDRVATIVRFDWDDSKKDWKATISKDPVLAGLERK